MVSAGKPVTLRRLKVMPAHENRVHDMLLALTGAGRPPGVLSNALGPGWVPTRMGGPGAPDDMDQVHLLQAWLVVSNDTAATVTGEYVYYLRPRAPNPQARDRDLQNRLLATCERYSSVPWPH